MNITIYIQKKNEEKFKEEAEKSKLVNELLDGYYNGINIMKAKKYQPQDAFKEPKAPKIKVGDIVGVEGIPGIKRATVVTGETRWTVYKDEPEYERLGVFSGDESLAYLAKGWKREIVK